LSLDKSVSVIIPNLHSPVIDRTLTSLKAQIYDEGPVEVLVVGQDKHHLVTEDELVRFVRTPRPVIQSIARNIGADQAQSDILVFIDADCIAAPTWLQHLISRLEDPNVDVVGGGVALQPDGYWTLCDNIAILYAWASTSSRGTRPYLASLNLAVRRKVWERLGGFDEAFVKAEDTEWSIRARLAGYDLHFEPRAVVLHQPPEARNQFAAMVRRAFESGYWTLKAFSRYREEIGLPLVYRKAWLMALSALVTAAGVTFKIFRHQGLQRFWYALPMVYVNKLIWRIGGIVQLLQQSTT
jgi:cellulose synthase/poly-beta-1,6-N-acetylglucosamine synthase-like glycosyltransferase